MFRYNDPVEAEKMRKEGNHRSNVNLNRLSFLSRSATDLWPVADGALNISTNGLASLCSATYYSAAFHLLLINFVIIF